MGLIRDIAEGTPKGDYIKEVEQLVLKAKHILQPDSPFNINPGIVTHELIVKMYNLFLYI